MADLLDITTAVASALDEIGVSGELVVIMGADRNQRALGSPLGDHQLITVVASDDPGLIHLAHRDAFA